MLKLLVVDDEKYDRESIITMLDKDFSGQLNISEAKNGREAIELSESIRPDIIIMDIKMPGINGIKAMQEIRKFLPNAYFIILTAYDYFDFALEAVKNNVKEYILKPFSKAEIDEKIGKAVDYVNEEKKKRKAEIENQEKLYNLIPVIENELTFAIINDSLKSIDYETYLNYLGFDFSSCCAMIFQIKSRTSGDEISEDEFEDIKLQAGEFIKEYIGRKYKCVASYKFTRDLIYFVNIKDIEDTDEIKMNMLNIASEARKEVKRAFSIKVRAGIGKCYSGLSFMKTSYEEAEMALNYGVEDNNITHYSDILGVLNEKRNIGDKNTSGDREKIALFKTIEQYIRDNSEIDLDLDKVAAKFNLSIYYFSRSFKEIVGYNFSDYINILRIRKAKELLKNEYSSIKEVCYTVGYSDPNYFSKVFKKYEGISPTEYKVKIK